MKFASILTQESLTETTATSVTADPQVQAEDSASEFPESYTPDEITLESLSAVKTAARYLGYISSEAKTQGDLLEETRAAFDASQLTPLTSAAIVAQLNTVEEICLSELRTQAEFDRGRLPEGVSLRKFPTMESITETINRVQPIVFKAMDISGVLSAYIQKGFSVRDLHRRLMASLATTEASRRPDEAIRTEHDPEVVVKLAAEGFQKGYSAEDLRSYLGEQGYKHSVLLTPLAAMVRGFSSVRLTKTRYFSGNDIKNLADFMTAVIHIQELGIQLCQSVVAENPDTASINDICDQLRKTVADKYRQDEAVFSESSGIVWISRDWPGVTIHEDGTTDIVDEERLSGYCLITHNVVSDAINFTIRDILPKISTVSKNAMTLAEVTTQAKEKLMQYLSQEGGLDRDAIHLLVKSLQTVGHLTFASIEAVDGIVSLTTNVSRGIGILKES